MSKNAQWVCTVCGKVGSVGRCCGNETRKPLNAEACKEAAIVTTELPTLRQYAAIELRVADSGIDWLDAMIRKANRDALAGQIVHGIISNADLIVSISTKAKQWGKKDCDVAAQFAYEQADALLAESEASQ